MTHSLTSSVPAAVVSRLSCCPMYISWWLHLRNHRAPEAHTLLFGKRNVFVPKGCQAFTLRQLRDALVWTSATGKIVKPQYKELRRFVELLEASSLSSVTLIGTNIFRIRIHDELPPLAHQPLPQPAAEAPSLPQPAAEAPSMPQPPAPEPTPAPTPAATHVSSPDKPRRRSAHYIMLKNKRVAVRSVPSHLRRSSKMPTFAAVERFGCLQPPKKMLKSRQSCPESAVGARQVLAHESKRP